MLRHYKQFLSFGRVFQNVRLHRVESVRCICKASRCKILFELPQKRFALGFVCKLNRHAAFVIR